MGVTTPDVAVPAGEDPWRSFDNAEATADLAAKGVNSLREVDLEGAMDMLLRANREAFRELALKQPNIAEVAGSLALEYRFHTGHYN